MSLIERPIGKTIISPIRGSNKRLPFPTAAAIVPFHQQMLNMGATHIWRMDATTGFTEVDVVSTEDGTIIANPTLGVTGLNPNDTSTAIDFNGSGKRVSVPVLNDTVKGAISFLIKVHNFSETLYVMSGANVSEDEFISANISTSGAVYSQFLMRTPDSHDLPITADGVISLNTMHYVHIQSLGSSYEIYVDGVKKAHSMLVGTDSGNWWGNANTALTDNNIGALLRNSGWATAGFDAILDEVCFFEDFNTATEIANAWAALQ